MGRSDLAGIVFFACVMCWISFFPQPIQEMAGSWPAVAVAALVLSLSIWGRARRTLVSFQDIFVFLFVASLLPGLLVAYDLALACKTWYVVSICLVTFYFTGKYCIIRIPSFRPVAVVFSSCSLVLSVWAVIEIFTGSDVLYKGILYNPFYMRYVTGLVRPMAALYNPAVLATYLVAALPFSAYLLKVPGKGDRTLGFLATVFAAAVVVSTLCRSSFAGLLAAALVYFVLKQRYLSLIKFSAGILAALVLFFFLPYPFSRLSIQGLVFDATAVVSDYRLDRIGMALAMLKDSSFAGVGLNNFRVLFDAYSVFISGTVRPPVYNPEVNVADNMYVTLLAEAGLIGLFAFLVFVFVLISRVWKLETGVSRVLIMSMTAFLVSIVGYDALYWQTPLMLFALLCGFMAGVEADGNG